MESVAARIKKALYSSGLNARNLAAMSHVHHTTIYAILRRGDAARPHATVLVSIDRALDAISKLVLEGKLPLSAGLSQETKQTQLERLIEQQTENE